MRQRGIIPTVIITALAAGTGWTGPASGAEYGDAARGAETVGRLCVNCHALPDGNQASAGDAAPPFAVLAQRPTISEESLMATLSAPHGPMPTETLSRQERADIIAYLLSLRRS